MKKLSLLILVLLISFTYATNNCKTGIYVKGEEFSGDYLGTAEDINGILSFSKIKDKKDMQTFFSSWMNGCLGNKTENCEWAIQTHKLGVDLKNGTKLARCVSGCPSGRYWDLDQVKD